MKRCNLLPLALILFLAACGGGQGVKPNTPSTAAPDQSQPGPSSGKGGYYLDDGPGENPPPNIDAIPDAVPRPEKPLARANRPYTALGKSYVPMTDYQPYKETGTASWYGKRYHGQKTSSGEVYDMYAMTGAHPTLPIPSYARVTNLVNGRSVVVRINDRGPFHSERIIDLSYAAAYKLRLSDEGSGQVEVEAIKPHPVLNLKLPDPAARPETIWPAVITPEPAPAPATAPVAQTKPQAKSQAKAQTKARTAPDAAQENTPPAAGLYVQVGVFKKKENADHLHEKLLEKNLVENVPARNWYNAGTYRVWLGPYASRQDADRAIAQIKQALGISSLIFNQ